MIVRLGYLSCRQASSFATLDWIQMRKRDVLVREEVTKKFCVCDEKLPGMANTTKGKRMNHEANMDSR